ncbi:hypothetical protein JVT61DRAFT_6974 [Boletus reticuloceps]|uniref:Uncharacterized protein n=1 Tax=Boletus reticuloceps TaxID=495285 RepID=A0A8I3A5Z3_9AGAM|nr:hypothetical protein JVT61DRAFT_6974 [Boletus reticuloceps]
MLQAASTNHAKVGSQHHSAPLSIINEHSSTVAADPTTTHPNMDKQIMAVQVAPEPQGNAIPQRAKSSHDLSLASGSEADHEASLVPKVWSEYRGVDDDEPWARGSSPIDKGGLYGANNKDFYANNPADMGLGVNFQGDDLYVDDDRDTRKDIDLQDDQEFPDNLYDAIDNEDGEERRQHPHPHSLPRPHQHHPSHEIAPPQAERRPSPSPRISVPSRNSLTNSRVQRNHILTQWTSSLQPQAPHNHTPSMQPLQSQQAWRHTPLPQASQQLQRPQVPVPQEDPLHQSLERERPQWAGSDLHQTTSPRAQGNRAEPFEDGQLTLSLRPMWTTM